MGYPNGVSLAVISGGTAFTAFGDDVPVQITVTPRFPKQGGGFLTRIVHADTGWVMTSDPDTFTAEAGTEVSFSVPHVDQAGFRDPAQNAYTGWYYEVKVVVGAARGRTKTAYTQTVSPIVGQALVDLDLVPEGQTGDPQSVAVPEVLSVNGQTGAVVVEAGADDEGVAAFVEDPASTTRMALESSFALKSQTMSGVSFRSDLLHRELAAPSPVDVPALSVLASTDSALRSTGVEVPFTRLDGTNATGVDIANDPSFWFDGTPSMDPSSDPKFVRPPLLPGGESAAANYAYAVETVTDATNTEIEFMVRTGTSFNFRAWVNGAPLSVARQAVEGLTSGGWYLVRFAFQEPGARRVRVEFSGRTDIASAYVPAGESLTRPDTGGLRVAILGDSYEGGAGASPDGGNRLETAGYLASHVLGARSIWNFGIGGTGYVNTASTYGTRVDAVLASDPDIVILSGSGNDITHDSATIRAAVDDVLSRLSAVPEVYVTGPSQPSGYESVNEIVKAAAEAAGRPFLDALGADPWLDASLIGSDGAHPTFKGHLRRTNRLAAAILEARELVGFNVPAALSPVVEEPVVTTLWADDFNRPDADTLGTDWSVANGTAGIRSNAAGILTVTTGTAFALRSGAADGVLRATISVPGASGPYLLARYVSGVNSDSIVVRGNASGNWALQKRVSGTATYVHESTTPVTAGDRVALTLDGTTVTLAVNDVDLWSGTITEHVTNTMVGFGAWSSIVDYRVDEMSFETLPA